MLDLSFVEVTKLVRSSLAIVAMELNNLSDASCLKEVFFLYNISPSTFERLKSPLFNHVMDVLAFI